MKKNNKEIARDLSMDEIQVFLIKNSTHHPIPEGNYDSNTPR